MVITEEKTKFTSVCVIIYDLIYLLICFILVYKRFLNVPLCNITIEMLYRSMKLKIKITNSKQTN